MPVILFPRGCREGGKFRRVYQRQWSSRKEVLKIRSFASAQSIGFLRSHFHKMIIIKLQASIILLTKAERFTQFDYKITRIELLFRQHVNIINKNWMFLLSWAKNRLASVLQSLGFRKKKASILFIGLDNSGKSTLLHILKHAKMRLSYQNIYPHSEEFIPENVTCKIWDLGSYYPNNKQWEQCLKNADAILYLIDSTDRCRIEETRVELIKLLEYPRLRNVPIAILGNKVDKGQYMNQQQLRERLTLSQYSGKNKDRVRVFMCSLVKRSGYSEALQWINSCIR